MLKIKQLLQNPLALSIYLPSFLLSFWRGILAPILPLYATSFEVSFWQVGVLLGALEVGQLVGDVPAGWLLGRLGQRRAMMFGAGTAVFSAAALFWTPTVGTAIIFQFLSGLGVALYNIARHLYLTEEVRRANRGKAIAGYGGINRIGSFMGPAIGGTIAAAFNLRTPFLVSAVLGVFILLFIWRYVPQEQIVANRIHKPHNLFQLLKEHAQILTAAGTAVMLAQTIRAGRRVIIPLFASEILGIDVQEIGFIVSAAAAVDMTLFPVAGWVMDSYGRKYSIVPSFMIQGVGMALVPLTTGFISLLLVACLIGFGNGLGSGTMMTLGSDLAPVDNQGEFLAAWRFVGDSGFALAPNIVGVVADLFMLGTAVYVIAGAGILAGVVFGRFVPETLVKETAVAKQGIS